MQQRFLICTTQFFFQQVLCRLNLLYQKRGACQSTSFFNLSSSDLSMEKQCSVPGNLPDTTSFLYDSTACIISEDNSRYLFANFGIIFSYKPSMSCTTSTCPSQSGPEPIPIVGIDIDSEIIFDASLVTISSTMLNTPASSSDFADSTSLRAESLVFACTL